MVTTASDFKDHGVDVPLLVGGAALSEKFTTTRIGPAYGSPTFYAKDAMTGLRIMNELMDPAHARGGDQHAHFHDRGSPRRWKPRRRSTRATARSPESPHRYSDSGGAVSRPARARSPEPARKSGATSIRTCCIGRHLGFKGNFEKLLAERDPKALDLFNEVEEVKRRGREVHEDPRGVAVFRSRARRQFDSVCSSRARRCRCILSNSAASRNPTACA